MDAKSLRPSWRRGGHLFMVLVAVACGVAGGLGAILFRYLIRMFQGLFFEGPAGVAAVVAEGFFVEPEDPMAIAEALPFYLCVAIPALGGLVVGPLIHFLAREARGHGVPEVMEAVLVRGGVMRKRAAAVKILASAVTIGSGGSVGREGPIIQIGAVMGSAIGQWLRVPARQLRTIVGCGAAAGIAGTFNAPIAGAIFAVEIIVGDFAVAQFSPIVIASVVATVISRSTLGNHPSFPVPDWELVSPFELVAYMLVGVIAGLVAVAFVRTLYASEDLWARLPIPGWLQPAVGGALVGVLGYFVPRVFGVGYTTIADALQGSLPIVLLGVLLVTKMLATSITLGSGGSGGVFTPSLFLGAVVGGLFGSVVHQWFPASTASSGAYALVTMGAMVSATTHAPIMAILMLFEMTQSISIIPPLMVACVVSTLVATFLQRDSIFTTRLTRRGIETNRSDDSNVLKSLHVSDIVDREPEVVAANARFPTVIDLIVESDHTEFFVVNEAGEYLGPIYLAELRRVLHEQDSLRGLVVAGDLVEHGRPTVTPEDDLDVVMRIFSQEEVEEIAVVEAENPHALVGSVHKRDVIAAYNQEAMRRDLAGGISSTVAVVDRVHEVQLGGDYVVRDIPVPQRFVGRSLEDLDLRARTGALVLLIRRPTGRGAAAAIRVPTGKDRVEAGDVLIVAGSRDGLERLESL